MSIESPTLLTTADRALLLRRRTLLGRMMKLLYAPIFVYIAFVFLNHAPVASWLDMRALVAPLTVAVALAATIAAVHAYLASHERRLHADLDEDLLLGFKSCHCGTLLTIVEGEESEPTRFLVSVDTSDEQAEFALRTIGELWRIRPRPLLGQRVEVEFAPKSRTVLQLRAANGLPFYQTV